MCDNKIYFCETCGNVIEMIRESGVPVMCCGKKMTKLESCEAEEEVKVCDLKPVNTHTSENYKICNCNNVTYFDILDAIHKHSSVDGLLEVFEDVKNTTHCTTGCGGCYDRVIQVISDVMMNGERQ